MLRSIFFPCLFILLISCSSRAQNTVPKFQHGDLIFQSSRSGQSLAIQLATHSKYSHVGMIYKVEGKDYVLEAIQPVSITPLDEWIDRGDDGHFVVKRLKDQSLLTEDAVQKMNAVGQRFKGKDYDLYFGWSDELIYCSELVWKVYNEGVGVEIGRRQQLRSFDLSHPVVKAKMAERYGQNVPMDEWVISPGAVFDSPLLEVVYAN